MKSPQQSMAKKNIGTKGEGFNMFNYAIPRIIFIVIFFSTIYLFTSSQLKAAINTRALQEEIFLQRLLYSPEGISYTDPVTGRLYPGTVDMDKLKKDESLLDSAFSADTKRFAARIQITSLETKDTWELFINKEGYGRWAPLTKFPRYDKSILKNYVLLREGDRISKGMLRTDVVIDRG
ncbi:hypothetical protein HYV84_06925 [Candidatus Woesearchaeota archaeon]|nr:hypothetical protein [Candidatus Woesearchaeota archaeon]